MQTNKVSQSFSNLLPLVGTGVAVGVATCGLAAQIFRAPSSSNKMRSSFGNLGNLRFYSGGFQERLTPREASQILGSRLNAPRIQKRIMLANQLDRAAGCCSKEIRLDRR
ncbi:uncharacterized protein LOC6525429 [Drosophila yakuba]|uniref:Uncharacterized protein n=1 Tax=Drosophila yakuba TaxID=7245 RepID=B4Q117_DROYA|nr:uncharacterized protein LOC6525429 [Drosophila yakuba]EDX02372.1 uncharacterized protein Dyak_GE15719 [Drosophila yakuba]